MIYQIEVETQFYSMAELIALGTVKIEDVVTMDNPQPSPNGGEEKGGRGDASSLLFRPFRPAANPQIQDQMSVGGSL